ncbi:hypothetical protein [Cellulomonas sp. URHE0023]|uniref:hypothetical protein n=1 Tax=Cellulomonas sp. URHE0023 TaxID=1380354 RepID=UPI0004855113|nr:hypothetical protein [Cellulomonas sp. URHE0023]
MFTSPSTVRRTAFASWVAAWSGVVLAPLHALARFATVDGAADLETAITRAWAVPAADVLAPLLDWASPETVYVTYGKLWFPIMAIAVLAALVVRAARTPGRAERWAWRVFLIGLVLGTLGGFGSYYVSLVTPTAVDASANLLSFPGIVIGLVGSTWLGIVLLYRRFRPIATGLLLATWLVSLVVLSTVVALGAAVLPVVWAFALATRSLARQATASSAKLETAQTAEA